MVAIYQLFLNFVSDIGGKISHLPPAETIIFDIALILILCAVFAFIAKVLRQPLIPAYVLAGLIIGPLVLGFADNMEMILAFSEIGIAFLLFTAGLEIAFSKIKEANLKKIVLIGFFQVLIIVGVVFLLRDFLGLSVLQASYIGIIMAFGSTMVDIKLLADSGEIVTLHGRLVLGILLFQDLVAIIAIVIFTTGGFTTSLIMFSIGKLFLLILIAMFLQNFVLNKLFRFAAKSTELLFLASLGVLFLFIILAYVSEISIVIGAFIAGVSLANSPFKIELESRIIPLRDFFAILFFVALGMQIVFVGIGSHIVLFIALLMGAFILKPFITFVLLRITGYQQKTSFHVSTSLAQLSEFSLIIGMLGVSRGILDQSIFSTVILATIISMSATPYFINYKEYSYKAFKYPLKLFRFFPQRENLEYKNIGDEDILIIGSHRMGGVLMKKLLKHKERLLVIDYNPEIISHLIKKKVSCIYGDITSPEILNKVNIKKLKLVVSTVPNFRENLHLLRVIKSINPRTEVIVTGSRISETIRLYNKGADYVITPKILAGEELTRVIRSNKKTIRKLKNEHLKHLRDIHNLFY